MICGKMVIVNPGHHLNTPDSTQVQNALKQVSRLSFFSKLVVMHVEHSERFTGPNPYLALTGRLVQESLKKLFKLLFLI